MIDKIVYNNNSQTEQGMMMKTDDFKAPGKNKDVVKETSQDLEGLGGWLLLVGLGVVVSPIYMAYSTYPMYADIFASGTWQILTTPGTAAYSPYWAPFLLGEIAVNVLMCLIWVYIAYLFFSKKKAFPKWYIGMLIFTVCFIIVDAFAIKLVMPNEKAFDPETLRQLGRSLLVALIWVSYMNYSVRVKRTFVNE